MFMDCCCCFIFSKCRNSVNCIIQHLRILNRCLASLNLLRRCNNVNNTMVHCIFSFPSCVNYETQPWNWRQDGCYPYYTEPPPPPINPRLDLPSLPADGSSSSCTTGGTECNLSNDPPIYNDSNSALPSSYTEEAPQERLNERFVFSNCKETKFR